MPLCKRYPNLIFLRLVLAMLVFVLITSVFQSACGGGGSSAVSPPTITSVSVSCSPTSVQTGQTSQCTATVTGTGSYSSAVNWSVNSTQGGNSTIGTISSSGLYTAPATVPNPNTVTVSATSVQDNSKVANTTLTVTPPPPTITSVSVSCNPTSVQTGATSQCTATVTGTGSYNSSVTWSASAGTINSSGLLTAPATAGSVTVTATSVQDTSKTGNTTVSVTPPPTITSVSVSCNPTSVETGQTSQCTATVTGTGSYNSSVTWSASGGTINSSGLFTAPATAGTVTVTATSVEDTTKSGNTTLTVTTPPPTITSVSVSCNPTSVQVGQTSQCTATVTGTGNYSSAVNWSVNGMPGGYPAAGTISSSGLYTAPIGVPNPNTVTVTATSLQDGSKAGNTTVTITTSTTTITSVSVSCNPTSVQTGQTSQCTATVTGTGSYNSAVNWSVNSVQSGNSTVGTISTTGLYTAPSSIPSTNPVTVTATSVQDTTQSGSATVTITAAGVVVSISPTSATVQTGATEQFTTTVTGSSNSSVTWSVNTIQGGNSTIGTISTTGLYTAPSSVPSTNPVTVTATSVADTTESASATVTITAASSELQISSLSETTANSFDSLTITGTGFSEGTAAISVLFTPENGDPPLMIPVSASDSGSVQVMVPTFTGLTSGTFTGETVDVQVVQFSSSTTYLSNTITGLQVNALPPVPDGVPVGAMTLALISSTVNISAAIQTAEAGNTSFSNASAALVQFNMDLAPMISAINTITDDPTQTVDLTTANGTTTTLNAQMLAQSDQLAQALIAAIVNQGSIPIVGSSSGCPVPTGNTTYDSNLCSVQTYFQNLASQAPATSASQRSKHVARPELTPPESAVLGLYANLILGSLAGLAGPEAPVIYTFVFAPIVTSYFSSLAVDQELPSAADTAQGVGLNFLDHAYFGEVPVLGTAADEIKALYTIITWSPPTKGILLSSGAATFMPGGLTILDPNTGAPTTLLQIPVEPQGGTFDSTKLAVSPPATPYTLTVGTTGGGSGQVTWFPTGTAFPAGTPVGLTAMPDTGSTFAGWSGAGCSGTGPCVVTMGQSQSVTADFELAPDSVTPSTITLGSLGGCAGGTLTTSVNITTAPGVTWSAFMPSGYDSAGNAVSVSPAYGSGSTGVTITITALQQIPGPAGCIDTTPFSTQDPELFMFSDGNQAVTTINYTYVFVN